VVTKDCDKIQKSDEITLWEKPLTKAWEKWLCWNATNTVIIDHHELNVDCNPQANVIIPPPFYVANMKDLSEDKDYLKRNLWPTLEGLYTYKDVGSFWSTFNPSKMQAEVSSLMQSSRNMAVHQSLGGEESCELEAHMPHCLFI